ncbi:MAG: bifunctional diaminohydroxyphosphoribosylaminopyrimidine deaminase/5-amino-6-(5-phosphoribosylamino)uracil reductase RibD [Candidatus Planktophila sp.]
MNTHLAFMQRAIALSENGLGRTAPNPIVGAVIVDTDGSVIAEGFHDRHKSPDHAEVVALKIAGEKTRGATMYVTLEPCNHTGTTAPCTQAIIEAGVRTVIYAVADPNTVAAGGADTLKAAGIEVVAGVGEDEASYSNRAWLTKILQGRPFITWKVAATLDGKVAAADGTSKWITNEASRSDVQKVRRSVDAIMVGTQTVIADDPHLIPRDGLAGNNPLRIICGTQELPKGAQVFDGAVPTKVIASKDLKVIASELLATGANHILLESGPTLATAMLQAGMLDELMIYQGASVLGAGKSFVADLGITTLDNAMSMQRISTETFGDDVKSVYRIAGK